MPKTFCFKCGHCGLRFESRYPHEDCHIEENASEQWQCGPVTRDYQAENVAINTALLRAAH